MKMGRGLSDLQKTILITALKRPSISIRRGQEVGADIKHRDIHTAYYGQAKRTAATRVAISRAMVRLSDRGLITLMEAMHSNWAGGNFTAKGKSMAKKLTVNKEEIVPQC